MLPVLYIFTHDSVGVGEDGPTHEPVETVATLRAIPGLDVIRPADPEETAGALAAALQKTDGPHHARVDTSEPSDSKRYYGRNTPQGRFQGRLYRKK
jgi:transketolase